MKLLDFPHHDGSELYLSSIAPKLGEEVTFKFRAGITYPIESAILRIYQDGEPRFFPMTKSVNGGEQWWIAKAAVINRRTSYRFLISSGEKYQWLNARGIQDSDVTSVEDFQILTDREFPSWIRRSVFYQIFPDRFATSGNYLHLAPPNFIRRPWNTLPKGRDKTTGVELFGGDLTGVRERISHIADLGANGIYFTPFFPAGSTHRYDASSFTEVDPLLGGNRALLELKAEADRLGIHLMGDLTTNHCGSGHPWFQKAKRNKRSMERSFFYFDKNLANGYEGWWGVANLPKLNYNSKRLRELMYSGKNSIVKRWLRKPIAMSGWRIDVGNMTGRYRDEDMNSEIITGIRRAVDEVNPDAWLLAENADHFPSDLDGLGWHGTMNYNGFMRPVWGWLKENPEVEHGFFGLPVSLPSFTGLEMVSAFRGFSSMVPWRNFVSSMVLLDSHDTARFRNVVGDNSLRHLIGMVLLLTYPGVPSIFAGDEIGMKGAWGEDARRTIDWDKRDWDLEFFENVKKIVKIRRNSPALADGGLRWVAIEDDLIAYLRESKSEKILVVVARAAAKLDLRSFQINERLYGIELKRGRFKTPVAASGIYRLA
ncbi:MAG: hypothetical protein RLZZ79_123 [Actinomycetota bacterium]